MQTLSNYLVNTHPIILTTAAYILYKNNVTFSEEKEIKKINLIKSVKKESVEIVTARKAVKEAEENVKTIEAELQKATIDYDEALRLKESKMDAKEAVIKKLVQQGISRTLAKDNGEAIELSSIIKNAHDLSEKAKEIIKQKNKELVEANVKKEEVLKILNDLLKNKK